MDILSKTDAVLRIYESTKNGWNKIHTTEKIKNSLNPDFAKSLIIVTALEVSVIATFCLMPTTCNRFDTVVCTPAKFPNVLTPCVKYLRNSAFRAVATFFLPCVGCGPGRVLGKPCKAMDVAMMKRIATATATEIAVVVVVVINLNIIISEMK